MIDGGDTIGKIVGSGKKLIVMYYQEKIDGCKKKLIVKVFVYTPKRKSELFFTVRAYACAIRWQ